MPFKTRKQKISASARRFTFINEGTALYQAPDQQAEKIIKNNIIGTAQGQLLKSDYIHTKQDLIKIGFLAGATILIQLALKFTGFANLFKFPN